jgi:D-alanine-D-alanine ligase-like ATP-grasp enzyme
MKRILMIANDDERWGPARLPEPLRGAGVEVAALCGTENPLRWSSFLARHFPLDKLVSWRSFGKTLGKTLSDWQPDLLIPCDEVVVVMLHHFLKRPHLARDYFSSAQITLIARSIGNLETLDAMVLKHETHALALARGVRVPRAEVVNSAAEALITADRLGGRVYVKSSFSWGGLGTIPCNTADQVAAAFAKLASHPSLLKAAARRVLARNWYPTDNIIQVQEALMGEAVMYSVAALNGKVLDGIFARRSSRLGQTGPSTAVEIEGNADCQQVANVMIEAMGASGFLAFDFIESERDGKMYLLESNPRPNQICHLGPEIGRDLCKALAEGLEGKVKACQNTYGHVHIPLFPQAWIADEQLALAAVRSLDIPANDPALFQYMVNSGERKGRSHTKLLKALTTQGRLPQSYTFA